MRPAPLALCLPLIHAFEGDAGQHEPTPRQDPVGNWEIGWGHKLADPSEMPGPITREQADLLAVQDLQAKAAAVCTIVTEPALTDLTDAQYAALVDFTYNVGETKFATSTLAKLVNAGNFVLAANEFARWIYGHGEDGTLIELPGLIRRRKAETTLWRA